MLKSSHIDVEFSSCLHNESGALSSPRPTPLLAGDSNLPPPLRSPYRDQALAKGLSIYLNRANIDHITLLESDIS